MPILPLASCETLPATIAAFRRSFLPPARAPWTAGPVARTLLPYCTARQRLSEEDTSALKGVCSELKHLADMATTQRGQAVIRHHLNEGTANDVISFWLADRSTV